MYGTERAVHGDLVLLSKESDSAEHQANGKRNLPTLVFLQLLMSGRKRCVKAGHCSQLWHNTSQLLSKHSAS